MNEVQKHFSIPRWNGCDEESLNQIKEKEPNRAFPNEIWSMLTVDLDDFTGKRILVPSSGNNFAVFAFSLLGANVTSTDFQQNVLDDAKKRASEHGLSSIAFVNTDTMTLEGLPDNEYDLVFTSNGVYNCLHNIQAAHDNFYRVLKPNGVYCFYENHPFYGNVCEDIDIDRSDDHCKGTGKLSFAKEKYATVNIVDSVSNFHTIEDYFSSLMNAGFIVSDYCDIRRCKDSVPNLTHSKGIKFIIKPILPSWMGIRAVKVK